MSTPDASPDRLTGAAAILNRLSGIEQGVDRLDKRFDALSARVAPIEQAIQAEAAAAAAAKAKAEGRAELAAELGLDVAPVTHVGPVPRKPRTGAMWDVADWIATPGGRYILASIVSMWITGWLGPSAGESFKAWLAAAPVQVDLQVESPAPPVTTPDVDEAAQNVGPPLPVLDTGPQIDAQSAPYPTL